jgi:hypothetical protein
MPLAAIELIVGVQFINIRAVPDTLVCKWSTQLYPDLSADNGPLNL